MRLAQISSVEIITLRTSDCWSRRRRRSRRRERSHRSSCRLAKQPHSTDETDD